MSELLKDLYVMAYLFARKLDPNRGFEGADQYARHICVLVVVLFILLLLVIAMAALNLPPKAVLGETPIPRIVFTAIAFFSGNMAAKRIIRGVPDFQSPERIQIRHGRLSRMRKIQVLGTAVSSIVAILGLTAARQFLGLFGGL